MLKRVGMLASVAAAVMMIMIAFSCAANAAEKDYVTIKGSDTMVHLAGTWAEEYMKTRPNVEVSVTGGGSGTGIAALLNGTTDIACASRKIKSKELKIAAQKKMDVKEYVVALDGIAVVVNPGNPVKELSMEQLKKIFTGTYTSWKQLGGPDQKIVVLSRESSSGTYVFFQECVLKKQDYARSARLMPATSAIIQSVSSDKWAIGYVGLGYAESAGKKVKVLSVKKTADTKAIAPSVATVLSNEYLIARPLRLYKCGSERGAFIDYCLSKEGQEIVKTSGYVALEK